MVQIIPILNNEIKTTDLHPFLQDFQNVKYDEKGLWKERLDLVIESNQQEDTSTKKYNWDLFNLSLNKVILLLENRHIRINQPQINPRIKYRNIFDRLVKEGQVPFETNDNGYISLTKNFLPHNLAVQLIGAGYYVNQVIYYMRFLGGAEFEKLLLDPRCKFSPNYGKTF